MSAYQNPEHSGRLVLIPSLREAFASIYVLNPPNGAIKTRLAEATEPVELYQVNEVGNDGGSRDVFNFPFLLDRDGQPWIEANSFLLSLVEHRHNNSRPTDDVRRKASRLLNFKLFCEENSIDWLDFSGKRPSQRPTFKYFRHLLDDSGRGNAVVGQFTGVVYEFYEFVSKNWHPIKLELVDTIKTIKIQLETAKGTRTVTVKKRGQTRPTPKGRPVPIGFVRDEGEDLRPLTNPQLSELLYIIGGYEWSMQERLIMLTALMTGARKQSVLTLRMKHLKKFTKENLQADGTYLVHAGPGTGIDTKFDKPQVLRFPKQLADDLLVLAEGFKSFRESFMLKIEKDHGVRLEDEDVYVFLSIQINCYYMAKDDPRYPMVKSRPTGQVTDTIKRKLLKFTSDKFPSSFSYHWLRATFAYQLYQHLHPLIKDGTLQLGEEISIIQSRLHHADRETTEHYLQLFTMQDDKLAAQESYEGRLFQFASYNDLILGGEK